MSERLGRKQRHQHIAHRKSRSARARTESRLQRPHIRSRFHPAKNVASPLTIHARLRLGALSHLPGEFEGVVESELALTRRARERSSRVHGLTGVHSPVNANTIVVPERETWWIEVLVTAPGTRGRAMKIERLTSRSTVLEVHWGHIGWRWRDLAAQSFVEDSKSAVDRIVCYRFLYACQKRYLRENSPTLGWVEIDFLEASLRTSDAVDRCQ